MHRRWFGRRESKGDASLDQDTSSQNAASRPSSATIHNSLPASSTESTYSFAPESRPTLAKQTLLPRLLRVFQPAKPLKAKVKQAGDLRVGAAGTVVFRQDSTQSFASLSTTSGKFSLSPLCFEIAD